MWLTLGALVLGFVCGFLAGAYVIGGVVQATELSDEITAVRHDGDFDPGAGDRNAGPDAVALRNVIKDEDGSPPA